MVFNPEKNKGNVPTVNRELLALPKEAAGFLHMWWSCLKLQQFWSQVHKSIAGTALPFVPQVMLLGNFRGCELMVSKMLLINLIAAATMVVVRKWKSSELPLVGEWLSKVRYTALMNKLSTICAYRAGDANALYNFNKQWELFLFSGYMTYQTMGVHDSILPILRGSLYFEKPGMYM